MISPGWRRADASVHYSDDNYFQSFYLYYINALIIKIFLRFQGDLSAFSCRAPSAVLQGRQLQIDKIIIFLCNYQVIKITDYPLIRAGQQPERQGLA
jgi:hypothetical protein